MPMADGSSVCKLAVVASHPIQYFTPLYQRLATAPGLDLEVFFCRDFGVQRRYDKQFGRTIQWDVDLLAGYRHRFLPNVSPVHDTFNPLHAVNPTIFAYLLRKFDALWLHGYLYPSNWLAAAAAMLRGTPILSRSELRNHADRPSRWFDALRDRVIRTWVQRSDALLYIGTLNRQAYLARGAREEQLFFCPYSVDVARLRDAAMNRSGAKLMLRERFGIPEDRVVVLFAGKLMARKHPEAVLECGDLLPLRERAHLLFVGSGPMEQQLRETASQRSLPNVTFAGFVNQQQLPRLYAASDVFAMPSENETWGLALNEAMAAGVSPVASDDVGAAADLIEQGHTGFVFPSRDWREMQKYIVRLVTDAGLRAEMGRAAARRSLTYSHEASVKGILDALSALGVYRRVDGAV